jgi:hypothetical protein
MIYRCAFQKQVDKVIAVSRVEQAEQSTFKISRIISSLEYDGQVFEGVQNFCV